MTLEELGAALRKEREKRKLNIDDVANQLKISPRQLRALEEGDVSALPHPAYARGFLRSYANWLGLGSEEIHEALNDISASRNASSVKPKNAPREEQRVQENPAKSKKSHKVLYFALILCLLCGSAYYLWQSNYLDFVKNWFPARQENVNELQSAGSYMAAKDAAKKHERENGKNTDVAPEVGRADKNWQSTPTPPITDEENRLPTIRLPEKETAAPNPAPAESGQHKLIITAIEECWIHSNADKTDTRQFSLRKGDTFALTFGDSLELKLGNAGGVRLRYDGNDLPPPGTSGQVKTLTFPPKN